MLDAGIVDQDVEPAQCLPGLGDRRADGRDVSGRRASGVSPCRRRPRDLGRRRLEVARVAGRYRDRGPGIGETDRQGPADAPAGTRHEGMAASV